MGNPSGIALFSYVSGTVQKESKLRVLLLAVAVGAVVVFGSIGVVRFANRGRQVTPAITAAAQDLGSIPADLIPSNVDSTEFIRRRDALVEQLIKGDLPVDTVRRFYQEYAMWKRDGRWDTTDAQGLTAFLGLKGM